MNRVTVLGLGMGSEGTLTQEARRALLEAAQIVGAPRLLSSLPEGCTACRTAAIKPGDIAGALSRFPACVVMSGDTGFFSGAKKLLPLLQNYEVTVLPGLTTVQYFAAKLGRPWQDVRLVSAHGLACDAVGEVLHGRETFFLTGGQVTPGVIAAQLTEAGLGDLVLHVGQRLSYPDEQIVTAPAKDLRDRDFDALSALWADRAPARYPYLGGGIPDEEFLRGDVPMTKREVRAAIPGLLRLRPGDTVWDVGAGTGSVSIELALLDPSLRVYGVERNDEACGLTEANRQKFGAYNLRLVRGAAPAALEPLPAPAAAFLGGSGGSLKRSLELLREKNPAVRVAVSAIAAETFAAAVNLLSGDGWTELEIVQISAARSRKAGPYHLMTGQNPIWLLSARGRG